MRVRGCLLYTSIQSHGDQTEYHDSKNDPVQFHNLTAINDHISQPPAGRNKFTNYNAYQTKSDVYLHDGKQIGNIGWKNNFCQDISSIPTQCFNQFHLIWIDTQKALIETEDGTKYCHRHSGDDDGFVIAAQPYDQQWRQGRFWQAVQHNHIRF